jgi:plastocyanin
MSGRSRISSLFVMLALAAWATGAGAATLVVKVTRPDGKPVAGAVVLLHGPPGSKVPAPATFIVDQVNQTFTPDLTVIPVGSTVTFPNSDKVSHQVYSFSPTKRFQLPLYRGTPYPPVTFANAGIVTLGCNIHDDMIAYLVVTDAGWFGRTAQDGSWTASNLPAGDFRVEVWHPRMREATDEIERPLRLEAALTGRVDVQLARSLRPEPLGAKPRSWSDY